MPRHRRKTSRQRQTEPNDLTDAHAPALTRHQSLVLDALSGAGPASAYVLLDRLREHGFRAPLQVYRALDKLIGLGLVHRLETQNAFVACAHPHDHASGVAAFAICESCGKVDEFSDAVAERRLKGWARDHSFKLEKTTIELRGTCAACLAA